VAYVHPPTHIPHTQTLPPWAARLYDRFWEGRKLVSTLYNLSREVVLEAYSALPKVPSMYGRGAVGAYRGGGCVYVFKGSFALRVRESARACMCIYVCVGAGVCAAGGGRRGRPA
jgi:hypothetical protein